MTGGTQRLPYPGLRAFNRDEADLFFGRDSAVNELILRLSRTRFLAVLGASGTGKSSLVRTGLLDGLELGLHPAGANWRFCDMAPGGQPIRSLARGLLQISAGEEVHEGVAEQDVDVLEFFLRRGPRSLIEWLEEGHLPADIQLLVLVDQFEELFRFVDYDNREEAEAFVKLLVNASREPEGRIHVVITMRSEFLGACVLIPELAETINAGTYLTPRMDREGCRQAIVGPPRMYGADVEPALVNRLLNDLTTFAPFDGEESSDQMRALARRADQLPVMQHVLNRIWREEAVDGRVERLRLETYERLGLMQGALDQHGAEILDQIGPERLSTTERIFRALVDGPTINTASRRPLSLADLAGETGASVDEVRDIVEIFRSEEVNFLRPPPTVPLTDGTVIDISHESLIRQWSRLSAWMLDEARAAAVIRRVSEAKLRYERGEGDLLSGLDLANIARWWEEDRPSAAWARRYTVDFAGVAAYLEKSEESETSRQANRAAKDARERRRLRIFAGATSAIAIAAAVFFLDARQQRDEAVSLRGMAQDNEAQMLAATEALAVGLVDRLDSDASIPVATKYGLIRDTQDAFAALADRRPDDPQFVDQRANFLLSSLNAMRAGGYWAEAGEFAAGLEAMVQDRPAGWSPDPVFDVESAVALADYHRASGHFEDADRWLQSAREANAAADPTMPDHLARSAAIQLVDVEIARQWNLYHRLLETAQEVWAQFDAELAEMTALAAGQRPAPDPQNYAQRRAALAELAYTVVAASRTAARTVQNLDADTLFGLDYPVLQDKAERAFEFARGVERFDSTRRDRMEIALTSLKASAANDNDSLSLAAVEAMDEAIEMIEDLCASDPTNRDYRHLLLNALIVRADYSVDAGQLGQASRDLSTGQDLLLEQRASGLTWAQRADLEPWLRYTQWRYATVGSGPTDGSEKFAHFQLKNSLASIGDKPDADVRLMAEPSILSTYVDLNMLVRDLIDYDQIRDGVRKAMDAHPITGEPTPDQYYNLAQRQYLYYQLVFAGPQRLGQGDWTEAYRQGVAEVETLLRIAPGEYRWINNQMSYQWSFAMATREAGDTTEAIALYRDAFDLALEAAEAGGIRDREYLGAVENAIKLMRNIVGFGSELMERSDIERLDALVSLHVTAGGRAASLVENEAQFRALADELEELVAAMEDADGTRQASLADDLKAVPTVITSSLIAAAQSDRISRDEAAQQAAGANIREQLRSAMMQGGEGEAIYWVRPPLFSATWHTLEGEAFTAMLATIKSALPGLDLSEISYIRSTRLGFYDDGYLIEAQLGVGDRARLIAFLVTNGENVFRLSGTSPPIHEANAKTPIVLETSEQVAAYIRFFTHYVNGTEGSFSIVENVSDIPFSAAAQQDEFERAQAAMRPFAVWPHPDDAELWQASGTVYYGRSLFHSIFEVQKTGMIEMLTDTPIVTDLEASLIRVSDREAGVRLNGEEAGKTIDVERINLARNETLLERTEKAIAYSVGMPDADGRALREDHVRLFLDDIYAATTSEPARDRNSVAYALLLADVDPDLALDLSLLVREEAPGNPYYADTLGWALLKVGRHDEGLDILKEVYAVAPDNAEIVLHLAQAYRLAGAGAEALEMLDRAEGMGLDPYWSAFAREERQLVSRAE